MNYNEHAQEHFKMKQSVEMQLIAIYQPLLIKCQDLLLKKYNLLMILKLIHFIQIN